jgi:hypothetical protein
MVEWMLLELPTTSVNVDWMCALTGSNFACIKVDSGSYVRIAAITLAEPSRVVVDGIWVDALDCNQSTKAFSGDILELGHDDLHRRLLASGGMALGTPSRCAL